MALRRSIAGELEDELKPEAEADRAADPPPSRLMDRPSKDRAGSRSSVPLTGRPRPYLTLASPPRDVARGVTDRWEQPVPGNWGSVGCVGPARRTRACVALFV